ncbi:MAG: hypothetical protein J0H49_20860 [Acidobacteria bacterium]|nr:hypothetical protein [Acidobacteriota bacterium]
MDARQATPAPGTRLGTSMGKGADMSPYPTAIMWTIWSTVTCTTRTDHTAMITAPSSSPDSA